MLRRKPNAVLVAHMMDRTRAELYVEGERDRSFFSWVLQAKHGQNMRVREIAFVDLPPGIPGGERGRLVYFANWLAVEESAREARIRMFADADWDRLLGRPVPDRVWLTDFRDLEGYVLREECVEKALRLGLAIDRIPAEGLLARVRELGRRLGLIRLMSEIDALNLPFQHTKLRRHLEGDAAAVSLNFDGYLRALLQNAQISLARLEAIKERLSEVEMAYAAIPDGEIIHGKDAMCIFDVALSRFGLGAGEGCRLLWTSFEARFVENGTALEAAICFLRE